MMTMQMIIRTSKRHPIGTAMTIMRNSPVSLVDGLTVSTVGSLAVRTTTQYVGSIKLLKVMAVMHTLYIESCSRFPMT